MTVNNATLSATLNGNVSAPYLPQASGNITVTVTQIVSETTTQTVVNVTVISTVTTTVANTTVTQANVTTTTAITGT
jgi:hypothetical protein